MDSGAMILFLVFAAVVLGISLAVAGHHRTVLLSYRTLAQRMGGRLERVGFWRRPRAVFVHDQRSAAVERLPRRIPFRRRSLQFQIQWPSHELRLEIRPRRFLTRLAGLLGRTRIRTGEPVFDQRYEVRGNQLSKIKELLTGGVQSRIDQLRHQHMTNHVHVLLRGGKLVVRKQGVSDNADTLHKFTSRCVELYEQAMLVQSSGMLILADEEVDRGDDEPPPVCRVCGEDILWNIVYCKTCQTPHHRECWKYFGACATYGCGQRKYVKLKNKTKPIISKQI